jgi:hypothetical protein
LLTWAILATLGVIGLVWKILFSDGGSAIFVCASKKMQHAMVRLCSRNGVHPKFRIDSEGQILRAFMSNGWIFNHVLNPMLLERMGNPKAAFALVVNDPVREAKCDAKNLAEEGFHDVKILMDIDPGVPFGKLVGLRFSEGTDRFCIIYRRHFLFMGEEFGKNPPAWKWEEVSKD